YLGFTLHYKISIPCSHPSLLLSSTLAKSLQVDTQVGTRAKDKVEEAVLVHRMGTKVVWLHCNPVQPKLFLSCEITL
ncbi:Protein DAMAGED DNA-BINDING 2, partial [Bienertia sinuspersici]